jgi:uncharacterized Fe-S cluster protein YjdI
MRKLYWGKDVDVTFDLDMCWHVGYCINDLPAVFQIDRKPWIIPDNASADEVKRQVEKCPSKALEWANSGELREKFGVPKENK